MISKVKAKYKVKYNGSISSIWSEDLKEGVIYEVFFQSYDEERQEIGNDVYIVDEIGDRVSLDKDRRIHFEILEVSNGIIN